MKGVRLKLSLLVAVKGVRLKPSTSVFDLVCLVPDFPHDVCLSVCALYALPLSSMSSLLRLVTLVLTHMVGIMAGFLPS